MRSVANHISLTFPAQPDSVPAARHALSEFAQQAGADAPLLEAMRLATSEAFTNAVLHAYGGEPGDVYLTAAVVSDELWVLVADDGRGLEPNPERPGLGLGLGLISQVSDELAIVPRATGGTEVRMRFDLDRRARLGRYSDLPGSDVVDSAPPGSRTDPHRMYPCQQDSHGRQRQQYA